MTFKTFSDKPQSFTFTFTFGNYDALVNAGQAIMGYFMGTYHAPIVEMTIKEGNTLEVVYAEDNELTEVLERICQGYNVSSEHQTKEQYKLERVEQLRQSEDFESLLDKLVVCELELMELADSVLDDDFPQMAVNGVHSNLEALDDDAMQLLKQLDHEGDYKALWQYASR
ncbi:hypothetical protein [Streptococcus merionis]|uniref:hypothetical protein n=1 Tax=Streptococcus merionis TaxID=400065 RepID=UPI003518A982